jgi:hypothetical protein
MIAIKERNDWNFDKLQNLQLLHWGSLGWVFGFGVAFYWVSQKAGSFFLVLRQRSEFNIHEFPSRYQLCCPCQFCHDLGMGV